MFRPPDLKCSSENVVYLFTCKACSKQYTESTEDIRPRFNNYRCANRNFLKRKKVKQESFNAHFAEVNHNGEDSLDVRLIDQTDNVEELRKRESFWQHELDTFQLNRLNECESGSFFIFNLSSLFVILTHDIYFNRWQWHILLYLYLKDFTLFIYLIIYFFTLSIFYTVISCFFFQ